MDHDYVADAVVKHPDVLGDIGEDDPASLVDDNICRLVSQRLWLVVLTERQHELVLSADEVKQAMTVLKREGA
jgi:hypothetical protein